MKTLTEQSIFSLDKTIEKIRSKQMSKEKPEVGDVWVCHYGDNCGFKTNHYIKDIRVITPHHCGDDECEKCNNKKPYTLVYVYNGSCDQSYEINKYLEISNYLGKSKANINELFEVQDE